MKNNTTPSKFTLQVGYEEFLVIGGSLSHIQRFIYDTPSQGALKNLRGRSFYLTLLTRAICDALLHRLGLKQDSVLYNSGGTFCIITPTAYCKGVNITKLIKDVKLSVVGLLNADMVNMSIVKASRKEIESDCTKVFDELFAKRHRAKYRPFGVDADYDCLFGVGNTKQLDIYESIGTKLSDISAILVSTRKIQSENALLVDFGNLGTYCYLGKANELAMVNNEGGYLLLINDEKTPSNCSMPIYREFIAGNGTRANSFEDLFTDELSSHERLAVLRMDVDNLGILLRTSMNKEFALQEYAQFSHQLDIYFKEYINKIWRDRYHDSAVIIYTGGDDLFIVGEWEKTLSFMQDINDGFKAFFRNEAMSLSGGIAFVKPKYPIIRAAEMSAEEESMAKSFEFNGKQKNAISVFETPLRWDFEYKWIKEYRNNLYALIEKEEIDKSFVQHILRIAENIKYVNGKVEPIRYIWLAAYDLSCMAKRKNRDSEGAKFIKRCIADLMSGRTLDGNPIVSPYHSLQLITIAARLVEMKLWKTNK